MITWLAHVECENCPESVDLGVHTAEPEVVADVLTRLERLGWDATDGLTVCPECYQDRCRRIAVADGRLEAFKLEPFAAF